MNTKILIFSLLGSLLFHGGALLFEPIKKASAEIGLRSNTISVTYRKSSKKKIVKQHKSKRAGRNNFVPNSNKIQKQQSSKVLSEASSRNSIEPKYPYLSRINNEEGSVTIIAKITKSGEIGRIDILQSSGFDRLDKEAIRVVKEAEFSPARKGDVRVDSKKELTFTFKLE